MATINFLDTDILKGISSKLSTMLPAIFQDRINFQKEYAITESIQVIYVESGDITDMSKSAFSCLKSSGRWHLQIIENGEKQFFARVIKDGREANEWKILRVFLSNIPQLINQGLHWINSNVPDDQWNVKLLEIPAYQITGLLLLEIEEVKVLIVKKASNVNILTFHLYTFDEMRQILSHQPITNGIIFNN